VLPAQPRTRVEDVETITGGDGDFVHVPDVATAWVFALGVRHRPHQGPGPARRDDPAIDGHNDDHPDPVPATPLEPAIQALSGASTSAAAGRLGISERHLRTLFARELNAEFRTLMGVSPGAVTAGRLPPVSACAAKR
jgi:hypothetical protein